MVVADRSSHLLIAILETPNGDELSFTHAKLFVAGVAEQMAADLDGAVMVETINLH